MHRSYKEQNGCYNCPHVVKIFEYDSYIQYFCTWSAPDRPRSGSVFMNEMWDHKDNKRYGEQMDKWDKWAENQSVYAWGICMMHPSFLEDN
jgi:hypothetical protein